MSSKTKIVVLRMKEIIYTAIFIGLGVLLVTLFLIMFRPGQETAQTSSDSVSYIPGVYSAALPLGGQNVNVEVCVDSDRITSVSCTPLSEAVETMYPLISPAVENLSQQICSTQSLENLTYPEGSQYTSQAIVNAVKDALEQARAE